MGATTSEVETLGKPIFKKEKVRDHTWLVAGHYDDIFPGHAQWGKRP